MMIGDIGAHMEQIEKYYDLVERDLRKQHGSDTFGTRYRNCLGVFSPTHVQTFEHIIRKCILPDNRRSTDIDGLAGKCFLDLGSGDGRGLAVAALLHMRAYGIEMDNGLVAIANKAGDDLAGKSVIPHRFMLTQGDFNDDVSYRRLGAGLSEMDMVFYSFNSLSIVPFFGKFARKANPAARLVLLGGECVPELYHGDVEDVGLQISEAYEVEGPTRAFGHYAVVTHSPHAAAAPSAHS